MATLGIITVGIIPVMLPILIEIRAGVFVNLMFVTSVTFNYKQSSLQVNRGASFVLEGIDPAYENQVKQIVEKFNKTVLEEFITK